MMERSVSFRMLAGNLERFFRKPGRALLEVALGDRHSRQGEFGFEFCGGSPAAGLEDSSGSNGFIGVNVEMTHRIKEHDTMTAAPAVKNKALSPFLFRQQIAFLVGIGCELEVVTRNHAEPFAADCHQGKWDERQLESLIADFLFFWIQFSFYLLVLAARIRQLRMRGRYIAGGLTG